MWGSAFDEGKLPQGSEVATQMGAMFGVGKPQARQIRRDPAATIYLHDRPVAR